MRENDISKNGLLIYTFPLQQNSKWKPFADVPDYDYVAGMENILVPAGKFDNSFKIKWQQGSLFDKTWDKTQRIEWFYSGVGIVRYEIYSSDGSAITTTGELKDYKVE